MAGAHVIRWLCLLAVSILILPPLVFAQPRQAIKPDDPQAVELAHRMRRAYADVLSYHATIDLAMVYPQDRWTVTRSTDYPLVYERPTDGLLLDRPGLLVVSDGEHLRVASEMYPARYMQAPVPQPMTFGALLGVVPILDDIPAPVCAALLSDDPIAQLSGGRGPLTYRAPDADGRPGLAFPSGQGQMTLRLDPRSHRIAAVELAVLSQGPGPSPSPLAELRYTVTEKRINQPIEAALFTFDIKDKTAVNDLAALTRGGSAARGAGGGGAGRPGASQAPAKPAAPSFEARNLKGQPMKLGAIKQPIVVLVFWASWAPPCRDMLPRMQTFYEWIAQHGEPAALLSLNIGERADHVRAFAKKQKLTFPILLDPASKIADSYNVQGIPHVAVIKDGRIVQVYIGAQPNILDQLKQQVAALKSVPQPAAAP